MAETLGRTRSAFRFPRVEVDLAGTIAGAAGYLAYQAVWPALASLLSIEGKFTAMTGSGPRDATGGELLRHAFLQPILARAGFPGTSIVADMAGFPRLFKATDKPNELAPAVFDTVEPWKLAVTGLVILLLVCIVGGAIARVYALRKARDESIGFDDAFAFSLGNLGQFVAGPFFMAAATAMFVVGGLAAGAAAGVPWAGPVLQIISQPLAILFALILTLLVVGAILGLPLYLCAVAVERNGSLDAVSRTYSYVFARPVTYGVGAIIVLGVASAIDGFSGWFAMRAEELFVTGAAWSGGGSGTGAPLGAAFAAARRLTTPEAPADAGGQAVASMWICWAFASGTLLLVRGFIVSYIVGGFCDLYFMLREEVEGVSPSEVFVEGVTANLTDPAAAPPR